MSEGQSLYIHYPYCKHLCNYCDFYKLPLDQKVDYSLIETSLEKNYQDFKKLCEENSFKPEGSYKTIYLGGGTPSLWGVEGAKFLKKFFAKHQFELSPDCEFTLEIDPGTWTEEGLGEWKALGVNRFSVGVQAFDSEFLKIMDRSHDLEEAQKTLQRFKLGEENFSADLMLGLPFSHSRKRSVIEELKRILEFQPSHLSVYILKTRKNYPHNSSLPEEGFTIEEYLKVSEFLKEQSFSHYEVSNFALEGKESRHNMKYWEGGAVHALGPNATGFLKLPGARAVRYQHKPSNKGLSTEYLEEASLKLEAVYLALRTNQGISLPRFFPGEEPKLQTLVEKWKARGYVSSYKNGVLTLAAKGFLMIDSFMDDLFQTKLL